MKEKPVHVSQSRGCKTKRVSNALSDLLAILPSPVVRDTQRRQSKSGGGDTSSLACIRAIRLAAVFYLAGVWIRFFPKESETRPLHFFQQRVFPRSEFVVDWIAGVRNGVLTRDWPRTLLCWHRRVLQNPRRC